VAPLLLLLLLSLHGCGGDTSADTLATQQVYFDRESASAVIADAGLKTPAVNPATGRRTLMPALYCGRCRAWRAAPPLEEAQRNPQARQCVQCRGPLSAEGPLPTGTADRSN
jgi:hypothetical protein